MKKLLIVAATVMGLAGMSFAQSSDVSVSTNVVSAITVATETNLAYGTIIQGNSKEIKPNQAGSGSFLVTGTSLSGVNVTFTFTPPIFSGTNAPTFTADSPMWGSTSDPTAAGNFTGGTTSIQLPANSFYVFVGGTVSTTSSTPPAAYTGTYTLAIAYN